MPVLPLGLTVIILLCFLVNSQVGYHKTHV